MTRKVGTFLKLASVVLALATGITSNGFAQATQDSIEHEWDTAKREWDAATRGRDPLSTQEGCQEAWDFVWSWAKRGSASARSSIAAMIIYGYMAPPGLTQDVVTNRRHIWILLLHGIADNDEHSGNTLRQIVDSLGLSVSSRAIYDDCIAATDRRPCVQSLVDKRIMPDFATYARELELSAAAPGARPVFCPREREPTAPPK